MTVDLEQCQLHCPPFARTLWYDGEFWHEAPDKCRHCWQDAQRVTR